MNKKGSKKIVLITGASSGIGADLALEIAQRGDIPVLAARRENKLQQLSSKILLETGIRAPYYSLDMSNQKEIFLVIQQIENDMGCIDVLINNAGFGVFDYANDAEMDDIAEMMQVNVLGVIAAAKAVLPEMINRQSGHIIFIGSIAGKMGTPKSSGYAASKHAVIGFANALRMELVQFKIKVSTVNPGPVKTEFFERADKEGTYQKNAAKVMMSSKKVAGRTAALLQRPKREINLPFWMGAAALLYQVSPKLIEWAAGSQFRKK